MDDVAQRDLWVAAKRLREVSADMGVAHISAVRAKDNGGPDFSERINVLLAQVDNLASDIEDAAGPAPVRHDTRNLHGRAGYGD